MKSKLLIVVVSVILGVLAAIMGARYLNSARTEIEAESKPVEVLVTKEDVPRGMTIEEMITRRLVAKEQVPQKYVASGAISSVRTVENQVLAVSLTKGEQLTQNRFQFPSEAGLAFSIPKEFLAVSIKIDEVKGVAGLLKSGDHVAVVATFSPGANGQDISRILLPKARVLAVGRTVGTDDNENQANGKRSVMTGGSPGGTSQSTASTVTLALSPKDVEKLVFAEEKGKVWLALLPTTDFEVKTGTGQTLQTVFK